MTLPSYPSYNKVDEHGPVTKYEKTVQTPMPNGRSEENTMTMFEVGDVLLKLSKISSRGWSFRDVTDPTSEYHSDEYYDDEQDALDELQTVIEGIVDE